MVALSLVGGLLFLLIFESGGTKYMFQYIYLICLLSGLGIAYCIDRLSGNVTTQKKEWKSKNMIMSRLSIIVPAYNEEETLEIFLNEVNKQTIELPLEKHIFLLMMVQRITH